MFVAFPHHSTGWDKMVHRSDYKMEDTFPFPSSAFVAASSASLVVGKRRLGILAFVEAASSLQQVDKRRPDILASA